MHRRKERPAVLLYVAAGEARRAALLKLANEACLRQNMTPTVLELPAPDETEKALARIGKAALFIGLNQSDAPAEARAFLDACAARAEARGKDFPHLRLDFAPNADLAGVRADLVDRLSPYRESDIAALHFVGEIPAPPAEYLAHPYTLLPAAHMAGRQAQLDLLTEWATATDHQVRILNVVAIGGMGKSAMTWKWYRDIAPQVMNPLAGRMWWSFYESDAHFENFVIRALAYVSDTPEADVREMTPPEREAELLAALDAQPYLIVLDGIERLMIAYARLDAARMDDEQLDAETANAVAGAIGLPKNAEPSMFSPNRLRKTADPRAGAFLRKLAGVKASRILVSSRLYPADLQSISGYPILGSFAVFLTGLEDADALALWRSFGCSGSDDDLLSVFRTFDNYPLLIRVLAGEVQRYAAAPGDFAVWRKAHRDFNPARQAPEAVKSHVMGFALKGLDEGQRRTLNLIASFRMPATFDALANLLVQEKTEGRARRQQAHFTRDSELDAALMELESRGLMGWDQRANRYDLHPIVRGVAWNALDEKARRGIYTQLNAHFGALPAVSLEDVQSLDDLTGMIEMYNTQIGLERYEEAFALFTERLNVPMLRRLSANLQRAELLEALFPDGLDRPARISRDAVQARALNALASAYHLSGQPGRAAEFYLRASRLAESEANLKNVSISLANLSDALRHSGLLYAAAGAANRTVLVSRAVGDPAGEAYGLLFVGLARLAIGNLAEADAALKGAMRLLEGEKNIQQMGVCHAWLAWAALQSGDSKAAREHADQAWTLADHAKFEADYVRAAWLQGSAALADDDVAAAETHLTLALTRARAANLTDLELASLIDLAELRRRQGDVKATRLLLDDVWEPADRGPFRMRHTDAYNVLTRLEIDLEQRDAARQVATTAFYLAWCDGAPYHYAQGMMLAKRALRSMDAPEPTDMPPFDEKRLGGTILPLDIEPA